MFAYIRKLTLAALVGTGLFVAGCQSSGNGTAAHKSDGTSAVPAAADQAVTCDKCKVTWRKVPQANDKGRVVSYTTRRSHECPDCRGMVSNFFATGKLEHTCKTCGDAMEACEAHPG